MRRSIINFTLLKNVGDVRINQSVTKERKSWSLLIFIVRIWHLEKKLPLRP